MEPTATVQTPFYKTPAEVIFNCHTVGDASIKMPDANECLRKAKMDVAARLTKYGGVFNSKTGLFTFSKSESVEYVENVLRSIEKDIEGLEKLNRQLDSIEAWKSVADIMVAQLSWGELHDPEEEAEFILEPSAGKGVLVDAAFERHGELLQMVIYDNNEECIRELTEKYSEQIADDTIFSLCDLGHASFLELLTKQMGGLPGKTIVPMKYILMFPPFTNDQYMEHVMHAYQILKEGGRLVALIPETFLKNELAASMAFSKWLYQDPADYRISPAKESPYKAGYPNFVVLTIEK